MDGSPADGWEDELGRWLEPFLARLRRQAQRHWAPFYLKGLLLPGERKSVEPMAARVKGRRPGRGRPTTPAKPARRPPPHPGRVHPHPAALPPLPAALRPSSPAPNLAE